MGVTDLFFELNYFKHKMSAMLDVIVDIATAVRSIFCKIPNSLVIVLYQ
jgi:hypothetical protein